jgi:Bacterial type II/III secretion system short domain/Secretin and TonB N terminus short domain
VSQPVASSVAAPVKPTETAAKSATDYVFVEPSYKPKDPAETKADNQPLPIEPSARALEAAAKFADKPASELMQGNAHAAMEPQAAQAASTAIQPAVNLAAEQKTQMAQQPAVNGPKYTGEPISVNLKDVDLKDFFRLIHEISGLNVVLDPNVHGNLTIVLDDVPWDQALDIVLKNNDLARELEGNVLRIATVDTLKKEADARRAQQESEALAVEKVTVTRFLSYAHSKDVVPTIKKFLSQRGDVIADERTNAIIISDIPNVIPSLDRLLTQLDRKTQEVEIEARVVAATRSFARDIGTQFCVGRRISGWFLSNYGARPHAELHHHGKRQLGIVDSVVFESWGNQPYQRFDLPECEQQRAHRRGADRSGVARLAEDPFPSARGNAEQHPGAGAARRAGAHRHAGPVGWSAHRDLRGCVPAAYGGSPDHIGRHDLPECGRRKHDA